MRKLIALLWLSLGLSAFGANPDFKSFFGTNGIVVFTNGNKVRIDALTLSNALATFVNSRVAVDPFVVIDGISYYPTNPWIHMVNEEWNGDPTSGTSGTPGANYWQIQVGGSGSILRRAGAVMTNAWSFLSINTTSAPMGATFSIGVSPAQGSYPMTNAEIIAWSRIAVDNTNTSTEIRTTRVGFSDWLIITNAEATNVIYAMINTNVNTNNFVLVSANAANRTFNYSSHPSNTFSALRWVNVGIHLDSTETNVTLIVGNSETSFTSVATNTANSPSGTLLQPILNFASIAAAGNVNRTNYSDNFHVWIRPKVQH